MKRIEIRHWAKRIEIPMLTATVAVWLIFALQTAPAWHDTAEFAAVGHLFTTSHSPGHPLFSLLSGGFSWLCPVGDVAFRMALFSALMTTIAFHTLVRACARLSRDSRSGAYWLAGAVLAPPVLIQGIRAEVYALHLCLFSLAVYCGVRWWCSKDCRWFLALALSIGLAGANHSYLALIPLPMVLYLVWRRRLPLAQFLLGGLCGTLGLFTYVFLPLRSASTEAGWGAPDSLSETWQMIRAEEWNRNLAPEGLDWSEQLFRPVQSLWR